MLCCQNDVDESWRVELFIKKRAIQMNRIAEMTRTFHHYLGGVTRIPVFNAEVRAKDTRCHVNRWIEVNGNIYIYILSDYLN